MHFHATFSFSITNGASHTNRRIEKKKFLKLKGWSQQQEEKWKLKVEQTSQNDIRYSTIWNLKKSLRKKIFYVYFLFVKKNISMKILNKTIVE